MVSLNTFLVPADIMSLGQLTWTFFVYGAVLFCAAQYISEGSEKLLFIPEVAGLIGSIVLPIMGAVPDGMMVLFSGLGPVEKAQNSVSVGVGALAGSTIMLLTIPWFLSIVGGRVDLDPDTGKALYKKSPKMSPENASSFTKTGITYLPAIRANAKIMLVTSLTYLMIQIPASFADSQKIWDVTRIENDEQYKELFVKEIARENKFESVYVQIALVVTILEFMGYMYFQYLAAQDEKAEPGCFAKLMAKMKPTRNRNYSPDQMAKKAMDMGLQLYMEKIKNDIGANTTNFETNVKLLSSANLGENFEGMMKAFYKKYANSTSFDNVISRDEFDKVLEDLHLYYSPEERTRIFNEVDADNNKYVNEAEFILCFKYLAAIPQQPKESFRKTGGERPSERAEPDEDDEEEEDEEMPDDIKDLEPSEQRKRIIFQSTWMMAWGTFLVLVFSDPMCEVLDNFGKQLKINPFYCSFVLAPLASNASELVAAYNYALKKTGKTITISLSTLEGAACMNNTFCLGIFFALIYVQGLAWKFTAETIVTVVVQIMMFIFVMMFDTQTLAHGLGVLCFYPLSLALVYILKEPSIGGLD